MMALPIRRFSDPFRVNPRTINMIRTSNNTGRPPIFSNIRLTGIQTGLMDLFSAHILPWAPGDNGDPSNSETGLGNIVLSIYPVIFGELQNRVCVDGLGKLDERTFHPRTAESIQHCIR